MLRRSHLLFGGRIGGGGKIDPLLFDDQRPVSLGVGGATYSPTIPMKNSWTEAKKNRPITIGATPTVKLLQNSSLYTKYAAPISKLTIANAKPSMVARRSGTLE